MTGARMTVRLPFVLAAAIGIGLIVIALVAGQPSAARASDELVAITSPVVSEAGVAQMRADLDQAIAVGEAIEREALPRLAALTGETPQQILTRLAAHAPQFTQGRSQLAEGKELGETIVGNLEARRDQFEQAASLPGLGLTLRDAAWAQLALAALLVAVGIAGLLRPRRWLAATVLGVGAVLVLLPLALGQPAKVSDTDDLISSLTPFPPEGVEARAQAVDAGHDVVDGLREEVIPLAAERAGTTPESVATDLAEAVPPLAPAGQADTAALLARFDARVALSRRTQPRLQEATALPAKTVMWLLMGPGIALGLAGAAGLLTTRRHQPSASTEHRRITVPKGTP